MNIRRKLKFSIFGWFVITLLILLATGKIFFVPVSVDPPIEKIQQSLDEILVEGLETEEKLANLEKLWNGRDEGYKVGLEYDIDPLFNTDRIIVNIVFFFDIETDMSTAENAQRAMRDSKNALEFVDKTLGEMAIVISRLNPNEILIISQNYISGEPSANIIGFNINSTMVDELKKETDPMKWSLYTELPKPGSVAFPNVGTVDQEDDIIINK